MNDDKIIQKMKKKVTIKHSENPYVRYLKKIDNHSIYGKILKKNKRKEEE